MLEQVINVIARIAHPIGLWSTGHVFAYFLVKGKFDMEKKQKQTSQNASAPQDETPAAPREKRKKNTTPVQKKEKPRPTEKE